MAGSDGINVNLNELRDAGRSLRSFADTPNQYSRVSVAFEPTGWPITELEQTELAGPLNQVVGTLASFVGNLMSELNDKIRSRGQLTLDLADELERGDDRARADLTALHGQYDPTPRIATPGGR